MINLKELLVKVLEGRCERLDNESDEDFITRCGNQGWGNRGSISANTPNNQLDKMSTTMQKKIVIPIRKETKNSPAYKGKKGYDDGCDCYPND